MNPMMVTTMTTTTMTTTMDADAKAMAATTAVTGRRFGPGALVPAMAMHARRSAKRSPSRPGPGRICGPAGILLALAVLLFMAAPLTAQIRTVDERRPLQADARVDIEAVIHSITIERWNRNEIEIVGDYDEEFEEIEIRGDQSSIRVVVRHHQQNRPNRRRGRDAELRIRVPEGVRLNSASVSGSVRVRGVSGSVSANSVSGDVHFEGDPTSVRLNSVSGRVTFQGNARDVRAQSVSGNVEVGSPEVSDASLSSVSGNVRFSGSLVQGGRLKAESHSGGVELTLPREVNARFDLSTFSGRITSDMPGATDERRDRQRYVPAESMTFTTGSGAGRVEASSFSGNVRIRPGD